MSAKTYQALVDRVKRQINSPSAQDKCCVEIQRQPDDSDEDWAHLLDDLGTVENVTMIPLDDTAESVRLRWNPAESMA